VLSGSPGPSKDAQATIGSLSQLGVEVVWLRYSSAAGAYVDLFERAAKRGEPPAPGEPISAGGIPATVQSSGDQTTISLIHAGTAVRIQTNLGRTEAIKVAQSLEWQ